MARIRQESLAWAYQRRSHYFVCDCDNFIARHTLEALLASNLPIVAPLLRTGQGMYSNYHAANDAQGYYARAPWYYALLNCQIRGLVQAPVVHCTYLVHHNVVPFLYYDDETAVTSMLF